MELECENPGPEEPCWGCRPCLVFILHEKDKELASLRAELGKLNDQWADSTRLAQEAIARAEKAERAGERMCDVLAEQSEFLIKAEAAMAAVPFFASVIKSGEAWSDQCEAAMEKYRALRNTSEGGEKDG